LEVSPHGSVVYVTNLTDDTMSVLNTATNKVIDTINIGGLLGGFASARTAPTSTSSILKATR
jgi:YVTN family beta-propeller protein